MREALFILLVIAVLLAWTAFRYRKTIAGMIGFVRMIKDAKSELGSRPPIGQVPAKAATLVNCSSCGVWVPQNKARKTGDSFFCSDTCRKIRA